jgi:hypothetical protein
MVSQFYRDMHNVCSGVDSALCFRCTMKDAKCNHGLFVRGQGTNVSVSNCKFTCNGMSGVAVLAKVRVCVVYVPCRLVLL